MILTKLEKYEMRLKNDLSLFVAILDPGLNFAYMKSILKPEEYESITKKFNEKFSDYYNKYSTITKTTIEMADPLILQSIYKKRRFDNTEEVENYSKISQDSGINPIEWWKMHECIYPCLSKFDFDVLCIPATSVPSEQVFSKAGIIITQRRNRLSDTSIRSLMCLNSMSKYFDSE